MKKILKRKLTYIAMSGFVLIAIACNDEFLDVPVTSQVTEVQLTTSEQGLNGLLIGIYSVLNGRGNGWYGGSSDWVWGSVRGGDANKGSNAGDQAVVVPVARFELDPVNGPVSQKWGGMFEGVARANVFLANLAASEVVAEEKKAAMAGEARFLRGHYYFELRINFKNVPWVDETMDYATGALEVPNAAEIWPMIEADFQYAFDNLPETQSQVGRANKWAAASYLAKTYMFQNKFTEAKALFDQIIANGQTSGGAKYELVPLFQDVFKGANENNSESIFAFQAAAGTGSVDNTNQDFVLTFPYNTGPAGPGECCGFYQPSFELANSYRTANGLPLLSGAYNQPVNALKTDQGLLSNDPFTPDQGPLDPRIDHTLGRRGIMFLDWQDHPGYDWIRDQSYGGPFTQKKLSYYKADRGVFQDGSSWTPGYQSINFMILRYADVLLMAAEAEIEVGSMEKAREYVNMVRQRALNSPLLDEEGNLEANYVMSTYTTPWADQETARMAVRFERKLELALEGQRFYDLLRWGVVADAMNAYLDYEGSILPTNLAGATFTPNQDEYLPIPQAQIDLQGNDILSQNPGY